VAAMHGIRVPAIRHSRLGSLARIGEKHGHARSGLPEEADGLGARVGATLIAERPTAWGRDGDPIGAFGAYSMAGAVAEHLYPGLAEARDFTAKDLADSLRESSKLDVEDLRRQGARIGVTQINLDALSQWRSWCPDRSMGRTAPDRQRDLRFRIRARSRDR
jgi:hypothetical protein